METMDTTPYSKKDLEQKSDQKYLKRYARFDKPETEILDGHPTLKINVDDITDIFGSFTPTKLKVKKLRYTTAKQNKLIEHRVSVADFDQIAKGKWTIEKMHHLIYANELPPLPTGERTKAGYQAYILANRDKII